MQALIDKSLFRKESFANWEKNTDFWLTQPLLHVADTKEFLKQKLTALLTPEMSVVDMGCGSGWLLEFMIKLDIPFTYTGLDFNSHFISHLRAKFSKLSNVQFEVVDFEDPIPNKSIRPADIVFNCFNFFELADLDVAFDNLASFLKESGSLVILTSDYVYLILAMSHDEEELVANLRAYEDLKSKGQIPFFFQHIDMGHAESKDFSYPRILYSFDDFFKQSQRHKMSLCDYGEVVRTGQFIPKAYQYIVFKK